MKHAAYILTTVAVSDRDAFAAYREAVARVNARLGGDMVLRGAVAEVLEGEAQAGEIVVALGFGSADEARAYIASPEYASLAAMREKAGKFTIRVIG